MPESEQRVQLTDEEALDLLAPHEVVRDPVHGDIMITALERAIIDCSSFQRLRRIKQLGPTELVYPGATHTRFQHSLGTLHVAEKLVGIVNKNQQLYGGDIFINVSPYPHLLVRLTALVHDIAHMPYGHTLEDEGNLAPPEWEDTRRLEKWMGPEAEIPNKIVQVLRDTDIDSDAALALVEDIRSYITCSGKDAMQLEHPFVLDLVSNTLCADLLDYVERDSINCGLVERTGDRVIRYLAVVKVRRVPSQSQSNGDSPARYEPDAKSLKGRVVLLTYRYEQEHAVGGDLRLIAKPEILSEAIDLLRRRFSLAEKVFFHRTKLSASAILISATAASDINWENAYDTTDETFLELLKGGGSRTEALRSAYVARRLYRPIYLLRGRIENDLDNESRDFWGSTKYKQWREPSWRQEQEDHLEQFAELPAGSVAIYCPERSMNIKRFQMLVHSHPEGEIKPLEDVLDEGRQLEMNALNARFKGLWRLAVYVDPEALDPMLISTDAVCDFSRVCEQIFGCPNDNLPLRNKGRDPLAQLAHKVGTEYETEFGIDVPHTVINSLASASAAYREGFGGMKALMEQHLRATMRDRAHPEAVQGDLPGV